MASVDIYQMTTKDTNHKVAPVTIFDAVVNPLNKKTLDQEFEDMVGAKDESVAVDDADATLVTTALRKTEQVLTQAEKKQVRTNINAADADDLIQLSETVSENKTNTDAKLSELGSKMRGTKLNTEGRIGIELNTKSKEYVYSSHIILESGKLYELSASVENYPVSKIYVTAFKLSDMSDIGGIDIDTTELNNRGFIYATEDCIVGVYYSGQISISIEVQCSLAYNNLIKRLTNVETKGRLIGYSDGSILSSSKYSIFKVEELNNVGNIHALLEGKDKNGASIAFYKEDGSYLKSESVATCDTNGNVACFFADVPSEASYAYITNYNVNHIPVIGTMDNHAKSEEIDMIEKKAVELKGHINNGTVIFEDSINQTNSYNGKNIDVSSYLNGTQICVSVTELESSAIPLLRYTVNGVIYNRPIMGIGDYWFEKVEGLNSIDIYLGASSSANNIMSYTIKTFGAVKLLHRQENTYIKVDSLEIGELSNGYYTQLYPIAKRNSTSWVTTPVMYSNGFKIKVDVDFTTYVVNYKYWFNNEGAATYSEKSNTSTFEVDFSNVIAWAIQIRRIDYGEIIPSDVKDILSIEVVEGEVFEKAVTKREAEKIVKENSIIGKDFETLKNQTINSVNFPYPSPNLYGHLFIDKINFSSVPTIPCQSVFDVAVTARMGFKMIEANVLITSDGIPVTGHQVSVNDESGYLNTLQDLNGNAVSVKVADVTFEELRTNYRYKSKFPQYQTPITSLEEFLKACKKYNITPFVQILNASIEIPIIESIVGKSYIAYNAKRDDTDVAIYTYVKGSVAELLTKCDNIGAPYILGVNANSLDGFTDEEIKTLIEGVHSRGCRIGWAGSYHSVPNNLRYSEMGLDLCASGWDVPDFEECNEVALYGNSVSGFSDFGEGLVVSGHKIVLSSGNSITKSLPQKSIISKGSLHIHFKGSLKFTFGHSKVSENPIVSDGLKEVVITSIIEDKAPSLSVMATENTEIYSISYKVASVI